MDYWINYRNYTFLLELKHSYFAYRRTGRPRANIGKKFIAALDQLSSIRKGMCRDLNVNKGIIKLALEVIVFYESSKKSLSADSVHLKEIIESYERMKTCLNKQLDVSFNALWILNKKLIEPFFYENSICEVYPAVSFIANISEKID